MKFCLMPALLVMSACTATDRVASAPAASPDWRGVATPSDRERLRGWRTAFVTGLAQARAAGHGAEIAREGALLEPDAGRADRPPEGLYRCRVIKLGSPAAEGLAYVSYPSFQCRIDAEGAIMSFRKLTGSQRPVGVILGDARRLVFLGTLMLSDEQRALDYGRDPDRDMIGAVESIGDRRWRLILPYPRYESLIDVIELVPA